MIYHQNSDNFNHHGRPEYFLTFIESGTENIQSLLNIKAAAYSDTEVRYNLFVFDKSCFISHKTKKTSKIWMPLFSIIISAISKNISRLNDARSQFQ